MKNVIRFLPLAFAALASVATSSVEDGVVFEVADVSPVDGAFDVDPFVWPSMLVDHVGSGSAYQPDPARLNLYVAGGPAIGGLAEVQFWDEDSYQLVYIPDQPLPQGEYLLAYTHGPETILGTSDARDTGNAIVVAFTVGEGPGAPDAGVPSDDAGWPDAGVPSDDAGRSDAGPN